MASIIGDNTVITLTDLALRTAGGDALGLDRALSRCLNEEIKPTTILRSVANHMMRLQLTLEKMQFGENPDLAISKLRPPVFLKPEHSSDHNCSSGQRPELLEPSAFYLLPRGSAKKKITLMLLFVAAPYIKLLHLLAI